MINSSITDNAKCGIQESSFVVSRQPHSCSHLTLEHEMDKHLLLMVFRKFPLLHTLLDSSAFPHQTMQIFLLPSLFSELLSGAGTNALIKDKIHLPPSHFSSFSHNPFLRLKRRMAPLLLALVFGGGLDLWFQCRTLWTVALLLFGFSGYLLIF